MAPQMRNLRRPAVFTGAHFCPQKRGSQVRPLVRRCRNRWDRSLNSRFRDFYPFSDFGARVERFWLKLLCSAELVGRTAAPTLLSVTLSQAENAHKEILAMNISSFNELGKLAWADCLKLYEDTFYQLNKSINNSGKTNDVQTWLSAAMANHQTCLNGFHDFQLSSHLEKFSSVLNDFSENLCNSLAINKATAIPSASLSTNPQLKGRRLLRGGVAWSEAGSTESHTGFLTSPDKKPLQQGTPIKADIVVAQDGSGNYHTISEALAAVNSMRNGTGRFVIYVKRGNYTEYVEIENTMNNLMFIGDGIDATIISGNRSN
uniref:Probable pectinesterase/pectinesterase inhibitor 6 n=1 Tax=Nicotiana tabacum TaxID=4097 RepID=A0A1S3X1L7_TOBAC